MTKDLEATLNELGPEYRAVVARLLEQEVGRPRTAVRLARTAERSDAAAGRAVTAELGNAAAGDGSRYGEWLRAASLALVLFLPCLFFYSSNPSNPSPLPNPLPREYLLASSATPAAVAEIVRTQQADGSWANDFLTRRNALALKGCADGAAQIAYRKAMRNLRLRGIL